MSCLSDGMGPEVLVVDDESLIRGAMARILKRLGKAPLLASDEVDARRLVEAHQPATVFLDLHLGLTNTLELGEELRSTAPNAHIVLMTGDHSLALPPWADDVLLKPFAAEDVQALLATPCHAPR